MLNDKIKVENRDFTCDDILISFSKMFLIKKTQKKPI